MYKCALILAAGQGKRIKSELPKVLHKVCGRDMVNHVIDTINEAGIEDINVIIGKGAEKVREATKQHKVSYSLQREQLGTGDAIRSASDFLSAKKGMVAILTGDAPLIKADTLKRMINYFEENDYSAVMLTSIIDDPNGYGRVVRKEAAVDKIVEHKDCSEAELKIKEINAGVYIFNVELLQDSLKELKNDNAQGEYYLTDIIGILNSKGKKVGAISTDFEETLGVNSRIQLARVEAIMRDRIAELHMSNGVTLIDPKNTYIEKNVVIEQDVIIYPGNVLQGNTTIKTGSILYPNNRIDNSIVGKNVTIQSSVILDSNIGENTTVGPFAYIRPESNIGNGVRIGDFVEIKKSTIGNNTKVSHLTYIGDAEVGEGCNFGCGTVVVNYDGKEKHKTVIGNNAFIGCNTNLVSPVEVKDNTYIAAGSTITKEVPEESLAIARARQVNIEGWVKKKNIEK